MLRPLLRSPAACLGLLILAAALVCAIGGASLVRFDPDDQDILARLLPPLSAGADGTHWLGTDALGRDVLARTVAGARVSLLVGVAATALSALAGITLGLVAGWKARFAGRTLAVLADMQLAVPFLVLALAVVAVLGPSVFNLVAVLGLTGWVQYLRVVRAECLQLRDREFVLAAQASGAPARRILLRHILPNVLSSAVVVSSLLVGRVILFEASLSYLGLGVPSDVPTWGASVAEGRDYIATAPWVTAAPGTALLLAVLGFNLVGDRVRDLLDPRLAMEG